MAPHVLSSLSHLPQTSLSPQTIIGILHGRQHQELTELIARLALHGPLHFIAGGDWVPDQNRLRRAVRRHSIRVNEVLDLPKLGRPSTCLQLRDQLAMANTQSHPILITDFLHRFYDPDVNISLRQRVLEQCCQQVKVLSQTKSVSILVECVPIQDYQSFFPVLESIADQVLEMQEPLLTGSFQPPLL